MILWRYFARRFAVTLGMVLGAFATIVILLDLIEQVSELSGTDATFTDVLGLAFLAAPSALYQILPLVMVLASIALFLSLARSSELVVTRAAGRSALRALSAPVTVTLVFGLLVIAMFNPIVAATSAQYDATKRALRGQAPRITAMGQEGLWMRQGDALTQTVIHATGSSLDGTVLSGVTFVTLNAEGLPQQRIKASSARLRDGYWSLRGVKVWPLDEPNPEAASQQVVHLDIPSTLTREQIRDSFGTPSSVPIWELPRFISQLQDAGFSATRHRVWFQSELAQPVLLVAMLLIGAAFTLRHQRGGRTGIMTLSAILMGFTIYFLRNFALVLGENGQIPVYLAAWAPPIAGIFLALSLLLHWEDG